MLSIADGGSLLRALATCKDWRIRQLLLTRRDQLGGDIDGRARFVIVQPGDDLETLQIELGFRVFGEPELSLAPEWVEDKGGILEAVWILTDCGFAHVAVLPRSAGIDPQLIELFASYASEHA